MDQGTAALWASSLAVLGTLGGTLGGAWVQRKAAVLQVREEAGAQGRARLREERRAAYARVLDCCDDADAALGQAWEMRQRAADGDGDGDGDPVSQEPVGDAVREAQRTLAQVRRAVAHVQPLGPKAVGQAAVALSKKHQQRVELLADASPVHVHPRGHVAYVVNRTSSKRSNGSASPYPDGENTIAVYALDSTTGEPRLIQRVDTTGIHCRTFQTDPTGGLLLAAHTVPPPARQGPWGRHAESLAAFRIERDGRLTLLPREEEAARPLFWMGIVGPSP